MKEQLEEQRRGYMDKKWSSAAPFMQYGDF